MKQGQGAAVAAGADGGEQGVSFVVPVFNKARWLPGVLRQLARQRGGFPRQYVFVDDGSTDDSLSILKEATAGWPDTTIVEQANRGPAHATNRALAAASMAFVKPCDADDLLADGATQALRGALIRHPGAVLAYGKGIPDDTGETLDLAADLSAPPVEIIERPLRRVLCTGIYAHPAILLRTAVARAVGGCDERLPYFQDYTLALRMAWGAFLRLDAPVALIRRGIPGQLSADQRREVHDLTMALAFFLDDHPDLPWHWKHYACRRAAGRARLWARRHRRADAGRFLALWLRAQLPILSGHGDFVRRCAQACTL